ncbi:MAG: aminodeoxychorismate synthase component I [Lentisphaerae bacterium]|nr:aminodeoxychorismate synthase component I [Lentisphaerota bacterium]
MHTLLIDNYDSFTFNLFQALAEVNGREPLVVRNDQLTLAAVRALPVDNIVISPGPGRPERTADFGLCAEVLRSTDLPVLGVCLGCQGLGAAFGARIVRAPEPMHGRLSPITHDDSELFIGMPQGFQAVRYHSLMVGTALPDSLQDIAWTDDGIIMGLRHRTRPLWGIQFHPESICTEYGTRLLQNFRELTARYESTHRRALRMTAATGADVSIVPQGRAHASPALPSRVAHWRKRAATVDPEEAFTRLFGDGDKAFWFDSSLVVAGLSRFTFMGASSGMLMTYDVGQGQVTLTTDARTNVSREDCFACLAREVAAGACADPELPFDFCGGLVGYLGYEMKAACGASPGHASPYPDAAFMRVDRFLAFDHVERALYVVCLGRREERAAAEAWFDEVEARLAGATPPVGPSPVRATPPAPDVARARADYLRDVDACRELIAAGESYEICLTHTLTVDVDVDPLRYYRELRRVNPAPYAAFLRFGGLAVLSSSPERFLRIDRERMVDTKPIKGTVPRGGDAAEDARLREALRTSVKNRAENLMIVDLMRNDLGRVCEIGSVHVPKLMDIETYATLHQMVSTVRGRLREGLDAVAAVREAFPAGSMTGAPKRRTMEILDRLETRARGVYSGACGYFSFNGTADFSVVIRTAVVTPGRVTIGAGGAVVALSDPGEEYAETRLKAQALLAALAAVG